MEIMKLQKVLEEGRYFQNKNALILAAGFEDRDVAVIEQLKTAAVPIDKIIIMDYENDTDNEPIRSMIINIAESIAQYVKILKISEMAELGNILSKDHRIVIDVTGMSRLLIFQILHSIDKLAATYDIMYTEAEIYYPLKSFYDELITDCNGNKENAFSKYLDCERAEIVYSYDCDIFQPKEFEGIPEPGKSAMLLAFFAFKRSRLQAILQKLELEKKVFILSEPVRPELKWRKELMEIVNLDLIQKNEPFVVIQNTLDPCQIMHFFEDKTYKNGDYSRYNLILAPLGSKMQTLGCYFYWRNHPEVSVVFSQPKSYFKDKYSKSYRDTFILPSEVIQMKTKRTTEYCK